jgi:hypothetical protein
LSRYPGDFNPSVNGVPSGGSTARQSISPRSGCSRRERGDRCEPVLGRQPRLAFDQDAHLHLALAGHAAGDGRVAELQIHQLGVRLGEARAQPHDVRRLRVESLEHDLPSRIGALRSREHVIALDRMRGHRDPRSRGTVLGERAHDEAARHAEPHALAHVSPEPRAAAVLRDRDVVLEGIELFADQARALDARAHVVRHAALDAAREQTHRSVAGRVAALGVLDLPLAEDQRGRPGMELQRHDGLLDASRPVHVLVRGLGRDHAIREPLVELLLRANDQLLIASESLHAHLPGGIGA